MIWILCAAVSVALLIIFVWVLLSKASSVAKSITAVALLLCATYAVYFPVYYLSFGLMSGAIGNFVHVLQVITVDADVMEYYDLIKNEIGATGLVGAYMIALCVFHFLLPVFSAITTFNIFRICVSSVRLIIANRKTRPLFVFSQLNDNSVKLAESLASVRGDVIFADCGDASSPLKSVLNNRWICKEESISSLAIRHNDKKDVYYFCLAEDENVSLSNTLQLIEKLSVLDDAVQKKIHIFNFSAFKDFSIYIDSSNKKMLDVQCVNISESIVYNLLDEYPLYRYAENSRIKVLLYGLNDINTSALKALVWCGQLPGFTIDIAVVGKKIGDRIESVKTQAPNLFNGNYNISFYDCNNDTELTGVINENCIDADYVIVCGQDDNASMDAAVALRRMLYAKDGKYENRPPVFCYVTETVKCNMIKRLSTSELNPSRKIGYDIIPFGNSAEFFTYKNIVESPVNNLAKNVHMAYEEIFSDAPINVDDALFKYNVFEVNKRSNRANALHIRYKLNLLGLDYTDDAGCEAVSMNEYINDDSIKAMAVAEHNRWMAFLETEGWTTASKEDVWNYKKSGISGGRHNCPLLKKHPYICGYDKLCALSTELEGKDTTVYDIELILKIPEILADKWGVSGKKYKIVKAQKQQEEK